MKKSEIRSISRVLAKQNFNSSLPLYERVDASFGEERAKIAFSKIRSATTRTKIKKMLAAEIAVDG